MQALLAALLVVACSFYAAWSLAPATARRRFVEALGSRWPGAANKLASQLASASCGGCKGCAETAAAKPALPAGTAPIVFVRRH